MAFYGESIVASLVNWNEPVYSYQEKIDQTAWPGYEKWVSDPCVQRSKTVLYDSETGNDADSGERSGQKQEPPVAPEEFYKILDPH